MNRLLATAHQYCSNAISYCAMALPLLTIAHCTGGGDQKRQMSLSLTNAETLPNIQYDSLLTEIEERQTRYAHQYNQADAERQSNILRQSRDFIRNAITDSMFLAWYGTGYDFSGMTENPRNGRIACGYFVSTVLKHAGFDVERISLAQQPALTIAKTLSNDIKRYPSTSTSDFLAKMRQKEEGLYLLGLSSHVGFMVISDTGVTFCHAAYYDPYEVVEEEASQSPAIQNSNYMVVGRLLTEEMMRKWLTKKPIPTVM